MTNLTLDKIKAMLGSHNDGVYRLETRENLGEIVGWLVDELEAAQADIGNEKQIREAFRRFISQAMTFRKINTDEWVEWFDNEAIAEATRALEHTSQNDPAP